MVAVAGKMNFWLERVSIVEINFLDDEMVVVYEGDTTRFGYDFYRRITSVRWKHITWNVTFAEGHKYAVGHAYVRVSPRQFEVDKNRQRAIVTYRLESGFFPVTEPQSSQFDVRATFEKPKGVTVQYLSDGTLHQHTFD
jgi:hypothetical protein